MIDDITRDKILNKVNAKIGEKRTNGQGYIFVLTDDLKWEPEHRIVMEKKLGRKLIKGESVHHKNGIRNDNTEANLELWVTSPRYGQRAVDTICPHCGKRYLED